MARVARAAGSPGRSARPSRVERGPRASLGGRRRLPDRVAGAGPAGGHAGVDPPLAARRTHRQRPGAREGRIRYSGLGSPRFKDGSVAHSQGGAMSTLVGSRRSLVIVAVLLTIPTSQAIAKKVLETGKTGRNSHCISPSGADLNLRYAVTGRI